MTWTRLLSAIALASLLQAGLAGGAESDPMPETVSFPGESTPGWVAAKKILTPEGTLDSSLFRPTLAKQLPALLALPEKDGCVRLGEFFIDRLGAPEAGTVSQAAQVSEAVLMGRVTGLAPGIRELEAGHLVRVAPVEVLKGQSRVSEDEYFFFMPLGTFRVGEKQICKTDPSYVSLPEVGDELMLFVRGVTKADVPYLDILDDGGVVLLSGDSFEIPPRYQRDSAIQKLDRQALISLVKEAVKGEVR